MATFVIGVLTGVAGAAVGTVLRRRRAAAKPKENLEERSTTSSAGGGTAAYETRKAVDEYLQFHFGADADILPYAKGPKVRLGLMDSCLEHNWASGVQQPARCLRGSRRSWAELAELATTRLPQEALQFPARCAQLCEKHCDALKDFNGEKGDTLALDIGCAVGGATFELARAFTHVLGIDYSHAFVDAAKARACTRLTMFQPPLLAWHRPGCATVSNIAHASLATTGDEGAG